jgi:hypothetical protein
MYFYRILFFNHSLHLSPLTSSKLHAPQGFGRRGGKAGYPLVTSARPKISASHEHAQQVYRFAALRLAALIIRNK